MNTGSQPPMTNARRRWVLLATVLGSAVVFLDGTVVNIALPTIGRDLPSRLVTTLEGQTYVYNVYLLSLSSLLLLAGSVSDRFGRRRTLIWGLVGFGMASLLCGIAPNIELLITFRFLQGAAGALLVPGSLALLREAFPTGPEQGRAFGRWASGTAVAILAGPLIGGILVDLASWRWVFLINIPVIAAALVAAGRGVARDGAPKGGNEGRLDWLNAGISVVAIGGITTSIIYGQAHNWQTVWVWPLLLGGLLAAGVLPFSLRRSTHPLVPLELFKSRDFVAVNLGT
ncbi:MAG TPA: MFS transporter, partial [Candidatus Dormibacteraeota bacterium]|nr:MFS transporter [Candidatus Dormibacteraeota bacterium]